VIENQTQAKVTVQVVSDAAGLPRSEEFGQWTHAALACSPDPDAAGHSVTIRVVDEAESAALNEEFRDTPRATNVLAFPAGMESHPAAVGDELELGDLVICAPVVLREAEEQSKEARAHFAHMTVHGSLHLSGYDHCTDAQADEMESLEKNVLQKLGFADPYHS
jgi:probable rRNA maturation factor